MWRFIQADELHHYGVKGMKWGVHRSKEELASARKRVDNTTNHGIIKLTIYGHKCAPKQASPNSIIDHVDHTGKINSRSLYDERGQKHKDIHTTSHGNSKHHNFGKNGEHVVLYKWNDDGSLKEKIHRELTTQERKEHKDIL